MSHVVERRRFRAQREDAKRDTISSESDLTRLAELAKADGETLSTDCYRILLDYLASNSSG